VASARKSQLDDSTHGSEPCHRHPNDQEREGGTHRSEQAHAEQQHCRGNTGRAGHEEALAHEAIIGVRRARR
jgi:hypothetical protein